MDKNVSEPRDHGDGHAASAADANLVRHFRDILLWPVHLIAPEGATSDVMAELLKPGSAWKILTDEFDDPIEFRERHYHELVTFLPPVRRFLYGEGASADGDAGGLATRVLRRSDVAKVRIVLTGSSKPVDLDVAHVDLYLFEDVDLALLVLEVFADDVPLPVAQEILFQFGRAYPSKWHETGRAANCPARVEWLDTGGNVLAVSVYEQRGKYLSYVCLNRGPLVAAHWQFLLQPATQLGTGKAGEGVEFRLLEGNRMALMAYLRWRMPDR